MLYDICELCFIPKIIKEIDVSSSCAVQGVVKLKREYLDQVQALYLTPDQGFNTDRNKEDVTRYLFGVNICEYINTHFTEKAANESFNDANFETGYLTFVSGFSSYKLDEFIQKVKEISDHYILYASYENSLHLQNKKVVIKNFNELRHYLRAFNNPAFIESEIPFEKFKQDGDWLVTDETDSYGFGGKNAEKVWALQQE